MKADRKSQAFRAVCMLNGIAMVLTGLYGVFWPDAAMNVMTGHDHVWDPQTLSLMRMHNHDGLLIATGAAAYVVS